MKESLKPGIGYEHRFVVPDSKTVPALYPESPEFTAMPKVFATGFLVGLIEWTCIKAVNPHLDWPAESDSGNPHRRQPRRGHTAKYGSNCNRGLDLHRG